MTVKTRPIVLTGVLVLALVLTGCRGRKAIPDLPAEEQILLMEAEANATATTDTNTPTGDSTEEPPATPQEEPTQAAAEEAPPTPTAETAEIEEVATPIVEATAAPPSAETPQPVVAGERTHVVQAGQNLFRIALMYGTSVEALASANNITNPALISVGQELKIPAGTTGPTQPETPAQTGGKTYVVKPGDNLFRIALRYNLDQYYLARYNGIGNPALIYVGQVIRIP